MPTTPVPATSTSRSLRHAVRAVATALAELREDPAAESVRYHIHEAEQAIGQLDRDLTTTVLGRLLSSIAACHRAGLSDSGTLADRSQSVVRALRLDPRWNPHADVLRSAG